MRFYYSVPQKYDAITRHNLHGVSLNSMVAGSWSYKFVNWVYVILARVGAFIGLIICEKLDNPKSFDVDLKLLEEEEILQQIEQILIKLLDR